MTPAVLIRHRLVVRFADCDPLGHANNAVYLTYLEQARFTLWRTQLDFMAKSAADPGRRGAGFILARAEVDFRAQVRYGDELEVRLVLAAVGRTSFTYACEIVSVGTGGVVAEARTVQVYFDYDQQKPVPIPDELKARLAVPIDGSNRPSTLPPIPPSPIP
jgi:acyl-CoA thioester hydrolase